MKTVRLASLVTVVILVLLLGPPAEAQHTTFAPGDVFVSFEKGPVQWRNPDGTPNAVLVGVVPGPGEGMRFDAAGNLYVSHFCADLTCTTGNTIEKFNINGVSQGAVGSGYNCNPHALAFDAAGNAYVGQADCTGAILKLSTGQPPTAYAVAAENRGSFWVDLTGDGCTVFYTSWGPDVKRFNVCTNTQLANFNLAPLPGAQTQGLRLLPDGGVLVSSGAVVARLNATGALVQTYSVSTGEAQYWAGLDLVGDGTFWAVNYYTSNVYKFNLTTGAVLASFNTGTPAQTAVDVRVKAPTVVGKATAVQATALGTTTVLSDTGAVGGTSDAREASLVTGSVPSVLSGEVLHAVTIGWPDQVDSEASLANLGLTVGGTGISADFVMAKAKALLGAAGRGTSLIDNLSINGVPIPLTGQPNQTIWIPGGQVVINEQTVSPAGTTVSALHATVFGVADVVIASVTAGIY